MSEEQIISDSECIRRYLAKMTPTNPRVRWTRSLAIMRAFVCGSTAAAQICKRHGYDPDERVRKP